MRDTERRQLAETVTATWPHGTAQGVWFAALEQLDYGHARRAYESLMETEHRPPSVARFLAEYHRLRAEHQPKGCQRCDGTGYVPVPDLVALDGDGEVMHRYSQVRPCSCPLGQAVWAGP